MTPIETKPLLLKPIPRGFGPLSEDQQSYLERFEQGETIAKAVETMIAQGRLVSFMQMFELLQMLHEADLIQEPAFGAYFTRLEDFAKPQSGKGLGGIVQNLFRKEKPDDYLHRHPFFRSQNPAVTALFCQHAEVVDMAVGSVLCCAGQLERDLYFMIEGEAAIYKPLENGGRRLQGFFGKGAVIGEVGFFIGELRTADVVCTKPSKAVVIRYDAESFGRIINKDIAKNLQVRFRVVHALTKSPFLKSIPEEALDALLFAGKVRSAAEFEVLAKEDEYGDTCYIVISGSVVVSKGTKNISVLGPGDAFGEIALFFTRGRRTATVMAQRDTTLLEIHAHDFYRILSENLLLAREFEKLALDRASRLKVA